MQELASTVAGLQAETEAAFDWLIEGLDRQAHVTFIPNPGNIGDAMINLACWRYLRGKFDNVVIRSIDDQPATEWVMIGGGGNLVEPLYTNVASLLSRLVAEQHVFVFPATAYGYSDLLRSVNSRARVLCRDEVSFRFVLDHMDATRVRLAHDAAFALAGYLQSEFGGRLARGSGVDGHLHRTDRESALSEAGGLDIMGQHYSDWVDMEFAERMIRLAAGYILGFERVHTDRLHGAILSAMLGRATILYPNSYFKNAAVFERSLARLPNVTFDRHHAVRATPESDPVAYRQAGRPSE